MSLTFLLLCPGPLQGSHLSAKLTLHLTEVLVLSHLSVRTEAPTPASHSAFYLLLLQYVSGVNQVDSASHILSGPERGVCDSTTCLQVGVLWCLVNCTSDHHDLSLAARCFVCLSLIRTDTLFLSSIEATQKIHPVPSPALGLPVYTPSRCTWLSLIHWPLNWREGSLTHSHM